MTYLFQEVLVFTRGLEVISVTYLHLEDSVLTRDPSYRISPSQSSPSSLISYSLHQRSFLSHILFYRFLSQPIVLPIICILHKKISLDQTSFYHISSSISFQVDKIFFQQLQCGPKCLPISHLYSRSFSMDQRSFYSLSG